MKEYLRMSDVFESKVFTKCGEECRMIYKGCEQSPLTVKVGGMTTASESYYAAHAINSHDEIVSKLDVAESTIYEVERVLSEMQRNGAFWLDDVIAEVECCIKRLSQ